MANRTVEIRVILHESLPGELGLERLDRVEQALIESAFLSGAGEFQGNEIGGGEASYIFEVKSTERFLLQAQQVLQQHACVTGAYALLNFGLPEERRVSLEGVLDLSILGRDGKRRQRPRIGDYYAIPLKDQRWGYGHFLTKEEPYGDVVQILKLVNDQPSVTLDRLADTVPAFSPVFTWVGGCIEYGGWQCIGNRKQKHVVLPPMRHSSAAEESAMMPGTYSDWTIRTFSPEDSEVSFVRVLTPEQRLLEILRPWSPAEIAERIASSFNPHSLLL